MNSDSSWVVVEGHGAGAEDVERAGAELTRLDMDVKDAKKGSLPMAQIEFVLNGTKRVVKNPDPEVRARPHQPNLADTTTTTGHPGGGWGSCMAARACPTHAGGQALLEERRRAGVGGSRGHDERQRAWVGRRRGLRVELLHEWLLHP